MFFLSAILIFMGSLSHASGNKVPLVIGHRGACGYRPEHTLASYELAIEQGADFIEPDLVMNQDHILIARHEPEISGTTDVAEKFPSRETTKQVDGKDVKGWFAEDFTLKEIKTLRAKERLPSRDSSFNGKFEIPTFEEVLDLLDRKGKTPRLVGVCPEMKHPSYFRKQGVPLEPILAEVLKKRGWAQKGSKIIVQSFELGALRELRKLVPVKLVFLMDEPEIQPFDFSLSGDKRTYGDLTHPKYLKEISKIADAIGPYKRMIVPESKDGELNAPTNLIRDAHAAGLEVYPYTFRSDPEYLSKAYKQDPIAEYLQFYALGIDGLFSDFSKVAIEARELFLKKKQK